MEWGKVINSNDSITAPVIVTIKITTKGNTSKFMDAGGYNKRIGDLEWFDREGWRKKINLLYAQKDVKTSRICMFIRITRFY